MMMAMMLATSLKALVKALAMRLLRLARQQVTKSLKAPVEALAMGLLRLAPHTLQCQEGWAVAAGELTTTAQSHPGSWPVLVLVVLSSLAVAAAWFCLIGLLLLRLSPADCVSAHPESSLLAAAEMSVLVCCYCCGYLCSVSSFAQKPTFSPRAWAFLHFGLLRPNKHHRLHSWPSPCARAVPAAELSGGALEALLLASQRLWRPRAKEEVCRCLKNHQRRLPFEPSVASA